MMPQRRRSRRHVAAAGVVLAYLLAAGVAAARGETWLALHLAMLGAATNAIVVWSEHFTAALLHAPAAGERAALARLAALNLAVVAVLGGVRAGHPALAAAGAGLLAAVVGVHAAGLTGRLRRGLGGPLGGTVWFYAAAGAALLAGAGLGVLLAGGAAGSPDATRAVRLAHAHLNLLGWVGLTVLGTQFTLWPAVLRTRMAPGLAAAVRWSFRLCVAGLALLAAGLLTRQRLVATMGLAGYTAGAGVALDPFARTLARRPPRSAAAWLLAAGMAWFALALLADLVALAGSRRVVDLDGRLGWLLPVVAVGFGLQVLTGALTYLLPTVWGRGAFGNRRLTRVLEAGWRLRVAALNLGVALPGRPPAAGRAAAGRPGARRLRAAGRGGAGLAGGRGHPPRRSGRLRRPHQLAARRSTEPSAGRSRKRPSPTRVSAQASSATARNPFGTQSRNGSRSPAAMRNVATPYIPRGKTSDQYCGS